MHVDHRIRRVIRSENGAVFVHVGIAAFVLVSFNVFVLDYGMMWVARRQAQNAADAGALAGALARGYDDFADPPHHRTSFTALSARAVVAANPIWNEGGGVSMSFDCPPGVSGRCTRVNVYRNGEGDSSPLPTLFGPVLGIATQGVKATATAMTGNGNSTNCLRPVTFPDDWYEEPPLDGRFHRYQENPPGAGSLLPMPDRYDPPSATQSGRTTISGDFGERIIWNLDQDPSYWHIERGVSVSVTLPGPGTYQEKLENCSGQIVSLGQTLPIEVPPAGVTATAFTNIIAQDPGATWDETNRRMESSCAPGCAAVSPRLIPVALFDPDRFQLGRSTDNWTQPGVGCPTNLPCITVTNIVGFFVHGAAAGYGPHGHFLTYPGLSAATAPTWTNDASWLVTLTLIR